MSTRKRVEESTLEELLDLQRRRKQTDLYIRFLIERHRQALAGEEVSG